MTQWQSGHQRHLRRLLAIYGLLGLLARALHEPVLRGMLRARAERARSIERVRAVAV